MDNAALVMPAIESGKQLLEGLDEKQFGVEGAFWFYREESEEWRLYIATRLVRQLGPREAYSRVLNVLKEKHIEGIDLSRISVVDVTDGLVTILRLALGRDASDISVNGNSVNGVYIRAAHIYRIS
jgi:hypothetical protein